MASRVFTEREQRRPEIQSNVSQARIDPEPEKSDELKTLWPGVHHDFAPQNRRAPSFYITLGFMGGAIISLVSVFGYSAISITVGINNGGNATTAVADAPKQVAQPTAIRTQGGGEVLVPATAQIQVQTGDTLAADRSAQLQARQPAFARRDLQDQQPAQRQRAEPRSKADLA